MVTRLPSGSQSIDQPISRFAGAGVVSTVPSTSTATIWFSIQFANHNRPSCHRGDSGLPSPLSKTSMTATSFS